MRFSLRGILAAVIAAANIFSINAQDNSENLHNFATFNVRYTNDSSDWSTADTPSEKDWRERGSYVMQIVKDYDFDIVGMEEVTGLGCKYGSTYGVSQLETLKNGLSDYTFIAYERENKDYSYNVIAYKTEKYELVETGRFWLSPTPDVVSNGWDPDYSFYRNCGWAKMKVKTTGEIFYFCVTHCNYGPSLDGPNGAKVIVDRLSAMADDYPVVLVGDFNMRRTDHPLAYREYVKYFEDAALTADANLCVPEVNGQIDWTTTGWTLANKATSGSEFDFIFYRNMYAKQRYVITENYGRTVNPSDHYPVMVQFILNINEKPAKKTLHVDAKAAEGGDGSITAPFKTISEAVKNTNEGDEVLVTADTYNERINLITSVVIKGGYDSSFQNIEGKTILDGENLTNLVNTGFCNLEMSNFELKNVSSVISDTDGAMTSSGLSLYLDNVDFLNNTATVAGAGLIANCRSITLNSCKFCSNVVSDGIGAGAVLMALSEININNTVFERNTAKSGSAIMLLGTPTLCVTNSTFTKNESKQYGTLYIENNASDVTYGNVKFLAYDLFANSSFVNSTFANNDMVSPSGLANKTKKYGGVVIYASFSSTAPVLNIAHTTMTGNSSTFTGSNKANYGGSTIRVYNGTMNLMNNIIAGNYSEGSYADVYIDETSVLKKDSYNLITAATTSNFTLSTSDFTAESYDACMANLPATLDGMVTDGKFTANVVDNGGLTPTIKLISTSYAGSEINVLNTLKRSVETMCNLDLNRDGTIGGALNLDQRGMERNAKSVPGACEYGEPTGIDDVKILSSKLNVSQSFKIVKIQDVGMDCLGNVSVYNISGVKVHECVVNGADCTLDLTDCADGLYIIKIGGKVAKVILKD